ncbi:MAG: bacterioferritin [Thiotrichaceae bacterium]|nr:bacterioferritin [Thiotrichaceae bacterium]
MKSNKKIIDKLNSLLTGELTAADQYMTHSRMLEDFGFSVLHKRLDNESKDEQEHADILVKRILFLEGKPDLGSRNEMSIGDNVEAMFKNDLTLEYQVADHLREVIAFCEQEQDYVTRHLLVLLLKNTEEDHMYWLEQQLGLISRVGLQNYLQSKM